MSRYIDADALIEAMGEEPYVWTDSDDEIAERNQWLTDMHIIEEAPTIEPKRGEWAKRTHNTLIAQVNFAYCSECGQPIMHEHTRPLWNFCPNCGADMREREGK